MTTSKCKYLTREAWLQAAVEELRPKYGKKLPEKIHTIISWPKGASKAQGQFFSSNWTTQRGVYICLSPEIKEVTGKIGLLSILMHELVHASLETEEKGTKGHGVPFKALATSLGLEGKMRSSHANETLVKELDQLAKKLGSFPHVPMVNVKEKKKPAGKTCVRYVSPVNDKYSCWVSVKQAKEVGGPICPISKKPMLEA